MPDINHLIDLTNTAIQQGVRSTAQIEALQTGVAEIKDQMKTLVEGFSDTQRDIVVALERLNTNLEDHKVIHQRITDTKKITDDLRDQINGVENSCSKDAHEKNAHDLEEIQAILREHGLARLRDGEEGHGDKLAAHGRFVERISGKFGWAILTTIIIGAAADFAYHYDFIKRLLGVLPG